MAMQEYFKKVLQQFRLKILVVMKFMAFAGVLEVAQSADSVCSYADTYIFKSVSVYLYPANFHGSSIPFQVCCLKSSSDIIIVYMSVII